MRLTRSEFRKRTAKRAEPVILFAIGDSTFAISAGAVDEIRNTNGLVPCNVGSVYSNLHKVKFTFERNGKTYLVVDSNLHFHIGPSRNTRLLVLRNLALGLLVDTIDRMCELTAVRKLPQAFSGEERNWYRGLTVVNEQIIPVVNPQAFLSKAEITVAQTELLRAGQKREEARNAAAGAASA